MKINSILLSLSLTAALATNAARADDVMSTAQAIDYLATMTAIGQTCADRYPQFRKGVDQWWDKNLDGPTGDWANGIRRTKEFDDALAKAKTDQQVLDVTEEQCKLAFD